MEARILLVNSFISKFNVKIAYPWGSYDHLISLTPTVSQAAPDNIAMEGRIYLDFFIMFA